MSKIDIYEKRESRAFTLFELILVIFIIGVIYTIIGISFDRFVADDREYKFENLKALLSEYQDRDRVELLCYQRCQECMILKDNRVIKEDVELNLDENLEVFVLDEYGDFRRVEFADRFIKGHFEKICLQFELFENMSQSEYIIYQNDRYYIFDSFFEDVNVTDNFSIAKEMLFNENIYPTSTGLYYGK